MKAMDIGMDGVIEMAGGETLLLIMGGIVIGLMVLMMIQWHPCAAKTRDGSQKVRRHSHHRDGWVCCPACGAGDMPCAGDAEDDTMEAAMQLGPPRWTSEGIEEDMGCDLCHATWTIVYKRAGYRNLEGGPPKGSWWARWQAARMRQKIRQELEA